MPLYEYQCETCEHRFEKIVLIFKLDLADSWWLDTHFGVEIARAIDCNYHLTRELLAGVFRYRIYTPGAVTGCIANR